jgi:DUF4097 and DUF4098 domain-containing protein YvlB
LKMLLVGFRTVGLMLAALGLWAQSPVLTQEGPNTWVNTISGSAPMTPQRRLLVTGRGQMIVRGGANDRITYKLTQRVRASSEADAQQMLGGGLLDSRPFGPFARIAMQLTAAPNVANKLEVSAPRRLASVGVQSQSYAPVEVYDLDGALDMRTAAGDVRADRIGGYVSVNVGSGRITLGKIGGLIDCYTGAGSITVENAVAGIKRCQTGGGEIVVQEAGAPVLLGNDGGNITVGKAAASVEAHAASGLIQIGEAGGIVTADTRGGSIQVGSARGIKAESGQGTVRVRGAAGPMTVSTALGNILAEIAAGAQLQDSLLAAGSGDITVLIPYHFSVSIMVTNEMGVYPRVVSEFPEVRQTGLGFVRAPVVAEGTINGGGPMLHVNGGTGVVYLRRVR